MKQREVWKELCTVHLLLRGSLWADSSLTNTSTISTYRSLHLHLMATLQSRNSDKHIYSVCVHESDSSKAQELRLSPWWRRKCWRCPNVSELEVECDSECICEQCNEIKLVSQVNKTLSLSLKQLQTLSLEGITDYSFCPLFFLTFGKGLLRFTSIDLTVWRV